MKLTVTDSELGHDCSPWLREKLHSSLHALCRIDNKKMSEIEQSDFNIVLSNLLKVYSSAIGKTEIYESNIVSFIFDKGIDALEFIEYTFHLTNDKGKFIKQLEDNKTVKEIFKLITNDKMNRTILAEKLELLHNKNKWIRALENDLEKVHYGEKPWDWFYQKHQNDHQNNVYVFFSDVPNSILEKINYNLE